MWRSYNGLARGAGAGRRRRPRPRRRSPRTIAVVPLPGSGARLIASTSVADQGDREDAAEVVDRLGRLVDVGGDEPPGEEEGERRQRRGDDEDRPPVEAFEQGAGEQRAERRHAAAERRPEGDRFGPRRARPERRDQRQRGRVGHPGGDAAEDAGDEQHLARGRERGEDRGRDRERHPQQQHRLAAVAVADRAQVEDRGRQPERVPDRDQVDDRLAGVEVLADVRQGDVGDREVEVGDAGDDDQRRRGPARRAWRLLDSDARPPRPRARCRSARGCAAASRRPCSRSPRPRGCGRRRPPAAASPRSPPAAPGCRSGCRRRRRRSGPCGGEWRTSTAALRAGAIISLAASSSRSKLHSQGVVGMPAPRPKNSTPSIVVPSPCSTVAAFQPAARRAARRSVSLLPGIRIVGFSIGASAPIVSSSPSWTEAKSPAPITTSASADISTSFAAWAWSRCRSLKASSLTRRKPTRWRRCREPARRLPPGAGGGAMSAAPPRLRRFGLRPGLQVEVEEGVAEGDVGHQQGEDEGAEQVDPEQREVEEDEGEADHRAGDDADQPEEAGRPGPCATSGRGPGRSWRGTTPAPSGPRRGSPAGRTASRRTSRPPREARSRLPPSPSPPASPAAGRRRPARSGPASPA